MTTATLIKTEGSPATLTVLGACGSQILPLLLTGNPFLTLWAWTSVPWSSLCSHQCPLSGTHETRLGNTRGEKTILTHISSSVVLQMLVFFYYLPTAMAFSESLKGSPCMCPWFIRAFFGRNRVEHWFYLTKNQNSLSFHSYLCIH